MRMSDYFRPGELEESKLRESGAIMAISEDAANSIINKWARRDQARKSTMPTTILPTHQTSFQQPKDIEAKLEQNVLDNVETNFLFNKGTRLTNGLIDPDRLWTVMNKLKELARHQLEMGSNEIDYQAIVKFVQKESSFFGDTSKPSDKPTTETSVLKDTTP